MKLSSGHQNKVQSSSVYVIRYNTNEFVCLKYTFIKRKGTMKNISGGKGVVDIFSLRFNIINSNIQKITLFIMLDFAICHTFINVFVDDRFKVLLRILMFILRYMI